MKLLPSATQKATPAGTRSIRHSQKGDPEGYVDRRLWQNFGPTSGIGVEEEALARLNFQQAEYGLRRDGETPPVDRFRRRRGKMLSRKIDEIASEKGSPVTVLDIGGRAAYWRNIETKNIASIVVFNYSKEELLPSRSIFSNELGDARSMPQFANRQFDLVHSNSVIEHVGSWPDMQEMAWECRRVGRSGWVQTPAWEFPIEPHQMLPFIHWFGQPLRRIAMRISMRGASFEDRRRHVDMANMLTRKEVRHLFPNCPIDTERFLGLRKSYIATW